MKENLIIIGGFNTAGYADYAKRYLGSDISFFHVPATWFILDKDIRERIIYSGDLLPQDVFSKIYDDSIEFIKKFPRICDELKFKGVNLLEVLRYGLEREYGLIIEAFLVLREFAKKNKPAKIVIDPSCYRSERCRVYALVAGHVFRQQGIAVEEYGNNRGSRTVGSAILARLRMCSESVRAHIKCAAKSCGSFVINVLNMSGNNKDKIYFYGAFHHFEQLMEWFSERGEYNLVYVSEGVFYKKLPVLTANKISWLYFKRSAAGRSGKVNAIEVLAERISGHFDEFSGYFHGARFLFDLVVEFVRKELYANWGNFERMSDILERAYTDPKAKAIFAAEDQIPLSRFVVDVSNSHKVETFLICHGIMVEKNNFIFSTKNIFAYGRKISERIKEYSSPEKPNIIEVGMPRLRRLKDLAKEEAREKICRDFRIVSDQKIIVFIAGNMSFDVDLSVNDVRKNRQIICFEALRKLKALTDRDEKICLIVKLHPGTNEGPERLIYGRDILKGPGIRLNVTYDIDLLVRGADLIVHCESTVAYHGYVAGTNVARVRGEVQNPLWEFLDSGIENVLFVDSPSFIADIEALLERGGGASKEDIRKYLERNYKNEFIDPKDIVMDETDRAIRNNTRG
ncbi:MAG: hypothetical protein HQL28_04090 [Candidatus Omnitrophica bacterium]|nr:hypothetical protein [Candidatus Omnitrophota bacterium]